MSYFPPLRTRRLTVQLKDISIGDAVGLADMPTHLEEAGCAALLNAAIAEVSNGPKNPAEWTVQERTLAVAHYLASVLDDGPDFSLGIGKYSDYLQGDVDISPAMKHAELGEIGEVGGDHWTVRHLTGAMAEAIERVNGELEPLKPRLRWILAGMAAQMVRKGETLPELESDGQFDEWLLQRMRVFAQFPEPDFARLMLAYNHGRNKLHHLFAFDFGVDGGIVILPKQGGAPGLPAARFPFHAGISRLALELAGKSD
jgi:hypothetical protein